MIKTFLKKMLPPMTPQGRAEREFLSVRMKEEDIAIDCGANVGEVTQHLCNAGAKVYSFEPNPYAFEKLKKRFSNNHNVHCYQKGVFVKNDIMKLYLHEFSEQDELYWSGGSSLLDFKGNVLKDKYVEIPVIDLCEFIESLNSRIRLLKMDVEGVECQIIKKLINTGIIAKIDYFFVEVHDRSIPELKQETEEIRELIKKKRISNVNLNWI